jgi:hypothetical protein
MRSRFIAALAAAGMLAGALPVQANGSASGLITYLVSFTSNGTEMLVVRLSSMTNLPSCASSSRFVLSAADPKFKTVMAALLSAHFTASPIVINGKGTCTTYDAASEDLASVCLGPDAC